MKLELPENYNVSEVLFHNLELGRGDKTCLTVGHESATYSELAVLAARVGNALRSLGTQPGARVLLLLLDGFEFSAAFFGAIRAGCLPIPANTFLSGADLEYFLRDSLAEVAIVSGPVLKSFDQARRKVSTLRHVIVVDDAPPAGTISWKEWTGAASTHLPPVPAGPSDPAFWLYSSGSTGSPKAVVHLQQAIPYTIECYARGVLGMDENDLVFSASKAFHAYGLGNSVTFSLGVGASSVLFPGRPTPGAIFEELVRHRPTLFFTVPTTYAAMLAAPREEPDWDLSSLRLCVSAAEALPPEILRRWVERFDVEILDGIGSTEMLHIFISNRPGQVKAASSGTPVPGYEVRIVDESGLEVPPGDSGDLQVRGESASPHYWNRPEAEGSRQGAWNATGDRYHRDQEGLYFYEGRSDDMLKVGGQWVSPVEVENTLMQHPAVLEGAVVGASDGAGLTRSKAFVILNEGYPPGEELVGELQEFARSRMAPYKYPRLIEFVDELPKTVTGKIQRFRLRE